MPVIYRNDIVLGQLVDIVLKKDQKTERCTRGHVAEILTNAPKHTRGIKVRLEEEGMVGRVQRIIS